MGHLASISAFDCLKFNVYRGYILLAASHPLQTMKKDLLLLKKMRQVTTLTVNYSRPIATTNCIFELSIIHKNHIQILDKMGRANFVRQNPCILSENCTNVSVCIAYFFLFVFLSYIGMIFSHHCLEPVVSRIVIVSFISIAYLEFLL